MQGRRGTLYHVEENDGTGATIGDIGVRKKFASGRFFFSTSGILYLIAMIALLIAAVLFLSSPGCPAAPSWYPWVYPSVTLLSAFLTLAVYIVFVLGIAEENPDPWIKTALGVTLVEVFAVGIVSILAITSCDSTSVIQDVPGPLGLASAVLLSVGAATLFIMWKLREESEVAKPPKPAQPTEPRKSLFV